jgi:superoxide dismutase
MKVSIKGFITCKSAEQYIDCADNYAINKSSHRFSVSDGVSKSFFPKVWSEILVSQFVERTDLKESELIKVSQAEWKKRIDELVSLPETKWFTKSQYSRKDPALATFVGLQFIEKEKKWSASALGDSFLFFVPNNFKEYQKELVKLSSKVEPIVFDNFPDYLTSIGDTHKGRPKEKSGNLRNGTFYLMTDALAEWFIKEGENAIGKITVWQSQADFERFISQAIEENQMTNDDCAILCIEITEVDRKGIEYKKIQVTDLNDLINEQEATNEKNKLRTLEEEKQKPEKEAENQKGKELETIQNESLTPESLEADSKEKQPKEGLISKVKGFFPGKEDNKEIVFPEKNADSEVKDIDEHLSEKVEPVKEEPSESETILAENQNLENDKNKKLEEQKIEEEAKSEKNEPENLDPKEKPKVDSKAKNIFDKF